MDGATKRKQSFLLRLPNSLREKATQISHEEGTSLNHFISLALAEKISRLEQSPPVYPESRRYRLGGDALHDQHPKTHRIV